MQEFEKTLHTERVVFNSERLVGDTESVMLGVARKECVSFHSGKLSIMALVTELADSALVTETGTRGYSAWFSGLMSDTRLREQWKKLLYEDLQTPEKLVLSSRKVVEKTKTMTGFANKP